MCLAVPMKVLEIQEGTAICEIDGVRREGSLMMLDEVAVGDYVLLHAGFAIEKIDPEEAQKTLEIFRDALDAGLTPE
jgi:hydrogenase expression/formation protein HypC